MDTSVVILILVGLMAVVGIGVVVITSNQGESEESGSSHGAVSESLRNLVSAQREHPGSSSSKNLAIAAAAEQRESRRKAESARFSLDRTLKYAQWSMTPIQFRGIKITLAVATFIIFEFLDVSIVLQVAMVFLAPSLWDSVLSSAIKKRFNNFDKDYPVMLMQYVSLLKTGMGTIGGLEAVAKGMDEDSLVRQEVELLIERLRLGLTEEQAINQFGETIDHPELELFVQSLLLSRRVGGGLSSTLERLAKQVRKRQQFREKAVSAVGMERGSIIAITGIMVLFMLYLGFSQPELLMPGFSDPMGKQISQAGMAFVLLGFYWSRKVTNIRV